MKLNKLLTPILGLATVSTIVAPIATSCSAEQTIDHVKISNKSEEVTANSKGIATYLFVLDSHDYDIHGFKASTTVNKKDTTGVVDSDFETTWEIDGDHLLVHVAYVGEEEPEDDITVRLNIHISYGTQWNKTFDVKMLYANATSDMVYSEAYGEPMYITDLNNLFNVIEGESYEFSLKYDTEIESITQGERVRVALKPIAANESDIPFADIEVTCNGNLLTKDTDYTLMSNSGGYGRIQFLAKEGQYAWKKGDKFKFKFIKCLKTATNIAAVAYTN